MKESYNSTKEKKISFINVSCFFSSVSQQSGTAKAVNDLLGFLPHGKLRKSAGEGQQQRCRRLKDTLAPNPFPGPGPCKSYGLVTISCISQ